LDEFNESIEGATMRVWEEQMKSFTAQFDLMKSAIEAAAIAIGSQILPLILPFVQSITQAAIRFTELNPEIIKFGVVMAGAVAAAGPLLWLLGSLATPFGAIIAGIGLLSATFITKWDEIERTVKTAVTNILGEDGLKKLENIWDTIKTIMFPEDEAGKSLFPPPVEITVDDLITVKPGDTLWSIFQENYADQYTWERFKEIVGLPKSGNQHILQVGEILTIPADLGRQFNTALEKAFKGREVFGIADWVDDADLRGPGGIN